MIKKLTLIALLMVSSAVFADEMLLPIVSVYDGDTIKTYAPMPMPLSKISVRIRGIDTPENPAKSYLSTGKLGRARCKKEAELALRAKAVVNDIAKGASYMVVSNYKWGKFGGRIVGTVTINDINIADVLIKEGLAVEYNGEKKSKDWCK